MKHYLQTNNNRYDPFDVFDDFWRPMFFEETKEPRTNIRETETDYLLDLALAGYNKDDIKVTLENGYLTVNATRTEKEEHTDKYLRREISESTSRSYYVGTDVTKDQIKAKFSNGMLHLTLPKEAPKKLPDSKLIDVE